MDRLDDSVKQLLSGWLVGSGLTLPHVESWFTQGGIAGESLVGFLCRQGVFQPDAPRSLNLMVKGYLASSCRSSVLAVDWETRIRNAIGIDDLSFQRPLPSETEQTLETHLETESIREVVANLPTQIVPGAGPRNNSTASWNRSARAARPTSGVVETAGSVLEEGSMRHLASPRPTAQGSTYRGRPHAFTGRLASPIGSPASRPSGPPTRGMVLGKYLLTEQIGKGTSGLVFRAVNQVLNLSVAVKVLSLPEDGSAGNALDALAAEARLLASLNHPNVVRLWDFEADPVMPYLVMEYVDGPSLAELIRQSGRLAPERAIDLICQAIEGLASAWSLGIVHRDVKPHNILIGRDGRPKIADLGLAVVVDGGTHQRASEELAGTAAYMSPEQGLLSGMPVDYRSDIYSMGATLYHTLTGRTPYNGNNSREIMHQHAHSSPTPPHELVHGLSPEVSEVVLTMMARHPDDRYQTAEELLRVLRSLIQPESPIQRDTGTVRTRVPLGSSSLTASGQASRSTGSSSGGP
ncbi:MAG: serine/threonine-protein kinase, partial [Gemmataceae bacterium]